MFDAWCLCYSPCDTTIAKVQHAIVDVQFLTEGAPCAAATLRDLGFRQRKKIQKHAKHAACFWDLDFILLVCHVVEPWNHVGRIR